MAIKRPKLKFLKGNTYVIDQSDASNANHPLRFTADSGATEYTHGVTATGTPGQAGATVTFNVPDSAPENIMYYCSTHGLGMGNHVKTFYDPASINYIGTRAFSQGGRTGDNSNYYSTNLTGAGYNNVIHLDIVTRSNSTRVDNIFNYPSQVGFQATGVRGSTVLSIGGSSTGNVSIEEMYTFNCATLGAATSHGNMTGVLTDGEDGRMNRGGLSDGDRCVAAATFDYQGTPTYTGTILYASIQNSGNAIDFGDLDQDRIEPSSTNDNTRGVFNGGVVSGGGGHTDKIDYVTIQSPSNATDFGNLTARNRYNAACTDKTVALVTGGRGPAGVYLDTCQYYTIQTLGNATSFGNLNGERNAHNTSSDGTTAVTWCGRGPTGIPFQTYYEYQTISTPGNATDFSEEGNHVCWEGGYGSGAAA